MHRNTLVSKRVTLLLFTLLLFSVGWAQRVAVSGVVKDATGEPVIGASVVVTGTSTGTVTDLDGKFRMEVPSGARTLDISYVGMKKQTVQITSAPLSVVLEMESTGLDELIVVGYGVVKKRDLTGSVSSVKSTDILKTTSSNAMQAMQARVPGLDIQQSNGQAGAGLNIRLRGNRSINASNDPLIMVDGVEYGSTLDINPSDIESMEVLKDASSTAIYGSRGSNGVILITTKRGQAGTSKVSVNSYLSSNRPANVPQVMYGDREVQRLIDKANYQADTKSGTWGASNLTPEQVLTETLEDFTEIGIYNDKSYTDWLDLISCLPQPLSNAAWPIMNLAGMPDTLLAAWACGNMLWINCWVLPATSRMAVANGAWGRVKRWIFSCVSATRGGSSGILCAQSSRLLFIASLSEASHC